MSHKCSFILNVAAELTISSKPVKSKLSRVLLTIHFEMYYNVCVWLFIAPGTKMHARLEHWMFYGGDERDGVFSHS